MALVEKEIISRVAVITLNNGPAGNVLNAESLGQLRSALESASADPEVRVLLLRGQGENFCLGMDLQVLQSAGSDRRTAGKAVDLYVKVLSGIRSCPKAVICLLNGGVKAGGVGLAGVCDIVVASENSSFELSEIYFGLIPANVMPFICPQRITPQKFKWLVLTARRLTAREALGLGLVDEVYPAEELEKGIRSVIKNCFRAAPSAVAETKRFTLVMAGKTHAAGSRFARDKLLELIRKPEVREAIASFNEGGTPAWFEKFRTDRNMV